MTVALLPLIGMSALYFSSISSLITETARQDLEAGAQHTAQTLESFFSENINSLQAQTQLEDLSNYLKGDKAYRRELTPHLSTIFRSLGRVTYQGYIQSHILLDENGVVIYDQTQLDINKDFSDKTFFQNTRQSNFPQITLMSADEHDNRSICFSAAIWDEYDNKVGVLVLRYNLSVLQYIIDETSKFAGAESFAIVTEQDGRIIGWHREPNPPQEFLFLEDSDELSLARNVDVNGNGYALVYLSTNIAPLNVIYIRPEASLRKYLFTSVLVAGAISLFSILITINLAIFLARQILKPISELTDTSIALSSGDWTARAKVRAIDEIGQLGNTFNQLADQIVKEVRNVENLNHELLEAYNYTLDGWAKALELRDKETEGHSKRVSNLAIALGKAMHLSEKDLIDIQFGSQLHDIGKMVIPDEILHKPGPLTHEERECMKKHPEYAYQILKDVRFLDRAIVIPRYHHEKWDGTGYPFELKGKDIPLFARVFCIADVWDAVTSDRPYNSAWSVDKARAYLKEEKGGHFDPEIVDIFLSKVIIPLS